MRRGFATEASRNGAPFGSIMRHGRWRHEGTVLGYIDEGKRFDQNAASIMLKHHHKKEEKKMKEVKKKNSQRLQILSQDEIVQLYAVPQFNATERSHYFLLPEKVFRSLKIKKTNGRNTSAKLWFILQYGYFVARHQFFHINYPDEKRM